MNDRFDELAKAMAQPIGRRAALKRFGVGLAAFALAATGLAPSAQAGNRGPGESCKSTSQCQTGLRCIRLGICSSGGVGSSCATTADCAKGLACFRAPGKIVGSCGLP